MTIERVDAFGKEFFVCSKHGELGNFGKCNRCDDERFVLEAIRDAVGPVMESLDRIEDALRKLDPSICKVCNGKGCGLCGFSAEGPHEQSKCGCVMCTYTRVHKEKPDGA